MRLDDGLSGFAVDCGPSQRGCSIDSASVIFQLGLDRSVYACSARSSGGEGDLGDDAAAGVLFE